MRISLPSAVIATSLLAPSIHEDRGEDFCIETPFRVASHAEDEDGDSQAANPVQSEDVYNSATLVIELEGDWTREDDKYFQSLAIKEALGTIEPLELSELEALSTLRRSKTTPPPKPEEVLQQLERWRRMNRVLSALSYYAEIIPQKGRGKSRSITQTQG